MSSERKLREDCWYDDEGALRCLHCGLYQADTRATEYQDPEPHWASCPLAEPPDVVKAAKSFRQQSADAVATGSIIAAHYADFCVAAWHQLERDFGFRLTEDGWEWTDE